jgi:hypothetical protein
MRHIHLLVVITLATLGCAREKPVAAQHTTTPALAPTTSSSLLVAQADAGAVASAAQADAAAAASDDKFFHIRDVELLDIESLAPAQLAADLRLDVPLLHVGQSRLVQAKMVRTVTLELDGEAPAETLVIAEEPGVRVFVFRPQPSPAQPWRLVAAVGGQDRIYWTGDNYPPLSVLPVHGTRRNLLALSDVPAYGTRYIHRELHVFAAHTSMSCRPAIERVATLPVRSGNGNFRYAGPIYFLSFNASARASAAESANEENLELRWKLVLSGTDPDKHDYKYTDYFTRQGIGRFSRTLEPACAPAASKDGFDEWAGSTRLASVVDRGTGLDPHPDRLAELFGERTREVRNGSNNARRRWLLANADVLFSGNPLADELLGRPSAVPTAVPTVAPPLLLRP